MQLTPARVCSICSVVKGRQSKQSDVQRRGRVDVGLRKSVQRGRSTNTEYFQFEMPHGSVAPPIPLSRLLVPALGS